MRARLVQTGLEMDSAINQNIEIDDLVLPEWIGTNAKGRATRELILRTALKLLVDEGYGAMSMRRVASLAGLKFGNLTYHYPSRDELVTELLDSVIKAYECAFDDMIATRALPVARSAFSTARWRAAERNSRKLWDKAGQRIKDLPKDLAASFDSAGAGQGAAAALAASAWAKPGGGAATE